MHNVERYARALKEVFEAEQEMVATGFIGEWEAELVKSEAYLAQRYVRVQFIVDGRKPKSWDVRKFSDIEYA